MNDRNEALIQIKEILNQHQIEGDVYVCGTGLFSCRLQSGDIFETIKALQDVSLFTSVTPAIITTSEGKVEFLHQYKQHKLLRKNVNLRDGGLQVSQSSFLTYNNRAPREDWERSVKISGYVLEKFVSARGQTDYTSLSRELYEKLRYVSVRRRSPNPLPTHIQDLQVSNTIPLFAYHGLPIFFMPDRVSFIVHGFFKTQENVIGDAKSIGVEFKKIERYGLCIHSCTYTGTVAFGQAEAVMRMLQKKPNIFQNVHPVLYRWESPYGLISRVSYMPEANQKGSYAVSMWLKLHYIS